MKKSFPLIIFALLALLLGVKSAFAFTAIDFSTPTVDYTNGNWSLGFEFTANTSINVTHLGFYDDGKNGLSASHNIGIFDNSGNLLVSATVNPSDALDGWFRYAAISPYLLPSDRYRIAAVTGSENYTWNPTGFIVDPSINYITNRYVITSGSSLVFPTNTDVDATNAWFGPNFKSETSAVPEPATMSLLGLGLLGLFGLKRKRIYP